jgi:hypothetical protein
MYIIFFNDCTCPDRYIIKLLRGEKMKEWLKSLSKKELRTWIRHMSSLPILFFATDEDKKNLQMAKEILKGGK